MRGFLSLYEEEEAPEEEEVPVGLPNLGCPGYCIIF